MPKKKKIKPIKKKTSFPSNSSTRPFVSTNQRIDQKNYRATKIHMPRRPK